MQVLDYDTNTLQPTDCQLENAKSSMLRLIIGIIWPIRPVPVAQCALLEGRHVFF